MAVEKSARGQPNSVAIGIWKMPKLARIAKEIIRIVQPAIRIGVKIVVLVMARSCCRAGRCAWHQAGSTGQL
jgi:hypothetical protein